MKSMFFFDSMLTPKIITFVYWFLLFIAFVSGVSMMFSSYGGFTLGNFLTGLIAIAAGALGARIWCELMIVLFKIHENLQKIANRPEHPDLK